MSEQLRRSLLRCASCATVALCLATLLFLHDSFAGGQDKVNKKVVKPESFGTHEIFVIEKGSRKALVTDAAIDTDGTFSAIEIYTNKDGAGNHAKKVYLFNGAADAVFDVNIPDGAISDTTPDAPDGGSASAATYNVWIFENVAGITNDTGTVNNNKLGVWTVYGDTPDWDVSLKAVAYRGVTAVSMARRPAGSAEPKYYPVHPYFPGQSPFGYHP